MDETASLRRVRREYRARWGLPVRLADPEGNVAGGAKKGVQEIVKLAVAESLRWGEPVIESGSDGTLYWGVPVMRNAEVTGGVVTWVTERDLFGKRGTGRPRFDVKRAMTDLRELMEEHNLTNAALLAANRAAAERERERAEAIHAYKRGRGSSVRAAYLLEEPALLAAIRAADRGAARAVLNRLLVRMIHLAGPRRELVKSLFLELVVSLTRAAVEAGAAPQELLGANYSGMAQLAALEDDEQISAWLREVLERVLDAIARRPAARGDDLAERALAYLEERYAENVSRGEVARALGVSESHLARTLSVRVGQSMPEIVARLRVAKAAEWLARTDKPLKLVALQAGFRDQTYFTKVFHRYMRVTPGTYRLRNATPPPGGDGRG